MSTAHPQTGRSDTGAIVSGPRPGTYATWIFTYTEGVASTNYGMTITAPYACRVMEISGDARTPAGTVTYTVENITDSVDIVADRTLPAAVEVITPTTTPALLNRDIDKGDQIDITAICAAASTFEAATVAVTVWVRGHVVASVDDD